jgi:hypothetical protein
MRVPVAQPRPNVKEWTRGGPLKVGLLRWVGAPPGALGPSKDPPHPRLTIIVKATFTFSPQAGSALSAGSSEPAIIAATLSREPEPISLARRYELPAAIEGDLLCPSDFVPYKPGCDVLLVGHASSDLPETSIQARVSVADVSRSFVAAQGSPAVKIPLLRENIRDEGGASVAEPVGPSPLQEVKFAHTDRHPADFDYSVYMSASPSLRATSIGPDEVIELEGLSQRAPRLDIELPGLAPRVRLAGESYYGPPVEMRCDTLWIDTDREVLVLVWRGSVPLITLDEDRIEKVMVSLELADAPRDFDSLRRELQRGSFTYAVFPGDLARGAAGGAGDEDDDGEGDLELKLEQFEAQSAPPEPSLSLERYAQISADLAEEREPRRDCLKRYDLDEDAWGIEDRAWSSLIAEHVKRGDMSLPARHAELFAAAQDSLAGPEEGRITMEDYAALKVAMEAGDPARTLGDKKMTLPQWMRVDRRWTRAALSDRKLKADLDSRISDLRARAPRALPGSEE